MENRRQCSTRDNKRAPLSLIHLIHRRDELDLRKINRRYHFKILELWEHLAGIFDVYEAPKKHLWSQKSKITGLQARSRWLEYAVTIESLVAQLDGDE